MPRFTSPLFIGGRNTRSDTVASPTQFPRRFPRLGASFQVLQRNVPAMGSTLSQRPAPVLVDAPWVERNFEEDAEDDSMDDQEAGPATASATNEASLTEASVVGYGGSGSGKFAADLPDSEPSSRPSLTSNVFLPLLTPFVPSTQAETLIGWKQRLLDWHATSGGAGGTEQALAAEATTTTDFNFASTRGRSSRNNNNNTRRVTNKRPSHDRPDLGFSVKRMAVEQHAIVQKWSGGKAVLSVRRRKRSIKRKMSFESSSWRNQILMYAPYMLGDYRKSGAADEAATGETAANPVVEHGVASNNTTADALNVKELWFAVLAYAECLYKDIKSSYQSHLTQRVRLSEVCQFLHRIAKDLPAPEQACDQLTCDAVDDAMWSLMYALGSAQKQQAKLYDLFYEEGVDVDTLRKQLDIIARECKLELDEMEEWNRQVLAVLDWQARLDAAFTKEDEDVVLSEQVSPSRNDLVKLELSLEESKQHGFRSKGLLVLEKKLEKAYQLQDRILEWRRQSATTRESTKVLGALVRELSRLKLAFPVGSAIMAFHRDVESWIDRATVAIRSRISLQEIEILLKRASEMDVNLSEYTEKLQSRVDMTYDWLARFKKELSCKQDEEMSNLEWINRIRQALNDGFNPHFHELASEGSRMPVDCDLFKILQVEMDARTWSATARRWIPSDADEPASKRGKLEDLEEHVEKAIAIRERLCLSDDQKREWELDGEAELRRIVDEARSWFSRHSEIIGGDSRRSTERCRLSMEQLRQIVHENDAVFANLGAASSKIARMLNVAEAWYEAHVPLLRRCGLLGKRFADDANVSLEELTAAVEASEVDLPIELDEAAKLRDLEERIKHWHEDCAFAAGRTKKRSRRSKKFTIQRMKDFIEEASQLPIDSREDVAQLQEQLALITTWQSRASTELDAISDGFKYLQEAITESHGNPASYTREMVENRAESFVQAEKTDDVLFFEEEKKASDDMSQAETVSTDSSAQEIYSALASVGPGESNVHVLIKNFFREASQTNLETPEGDIAFELKNVSQWCARSIRYLESQRNVFDKRFFGSFDRFVAEGKALLTLGGVRSATASAQAGTYSRLRDSWKGVVRDQMIRLDILMSERSCFVEFCKNAEQLLSGETRITVKKLQDIELKSRSFPSDCDLIRKITELSRRSLRWRTEAKALLSSHQKVTMTDAKALLDSGEKLGIACDELKELRGGIRLARAWCSQVKRCSLNNGATNTEDVTRLLEEHDKLLVEMPDEAAKLRSAMCNYCICRRPFDGFMIACDSCDDWFHGPCIGITESKAGKTEKYVCIRCSIVRSYKTCASGAIGFIRKWANDTDRKKARQSDAQKLQRKIRKDNKDMATLKLEQSSIVDRLKVLDRPARDYLVTVDFLAAEAMHLEAKSCGEPLKELSTAFVETQEDTVNTNFESSDFPLREQSTGIIKEHVVVESIEGGLQTTEAPAQSPVDAFATGPVQLGSSADKSSTNKTSSEELYKSKEECEARLEKIAESLEAIMKRLAEVTVQANLRRNEQELEDASTLALKKWFLDVLALALIPSTSILADKSRPEGGSITETMQTLIQDAARDGLARFKDVQDTINSFKCMAWCVGASSIIARRPSDSELVALVRLGQNIIFNDDKAFRALKSILARVRSWDAKVKKALTPIPGDVRPFNLASLKDLAEMADDIPLTLPLQSRLATIIDDNGSRHCLCGGPSDGRFMLCCDTCNKWFHGLCVGVKGMDAEEWNCPVCAGSPQATVDDKTLSEFHETFTIDEDNVSTMADDSDDDVSSKAPNAKNMWPPFGLLGSEQAKEALGADFPPYSVQPDGTIMLTPTPRVVVATAPRPIEVTEPFLPPKLPKNPSVPKAHKPKPAKKPSPPVTASTASAVVARPTAAPTAVKQHAPNYPPPFAFSAPLSNQVMQNMQQMFAWQHSAMMPMSMLPPSSASANNIYADQQCGINNNSAYQAGATAAKNGQQNGTHVAPSAASSVSSIASGSLSLDVLKNVGCDRRLLNHGPPVTNHDDSTMDR
ncbi:hypothetical protein MPSEU_000667700 [Mayamaea pseudoterrestris]|nr:hypothetical protein MPSEU_000667700 [Mayamaea pseudoterrestris]